MLADTTTKFAHHGMNGSLLPPMDTGVRWEIGKTAEVTWQVRKYTCTTTVIVCSSPLARSLLSV
jgi:hypothetical protein|eukprot:SAG25_NODE_1660_length_2591_cov_1.648876_4_plen_64_part_00